MYIYSKSYSHMRIANDTYYAHTYAHMYDECTPSALCHGTPVPRQKFLSKMLLSRLYRDVCVSLLQPPKLHYLPLLLYYINVDGNIQAYSLPSFLRKCSGEHSQ